MNSKKFYVTVIIVILIIIVFLFSCGFFDREKKCERSLYNLGYDFYTKYYYDKISLNNKNTSKFLKKYKDIGIVVSLNNIKKYTKNLDTKDLNRLEKAKCDEYKSTINIYPKSPYKKMDFSIKVSLSCESL